MAFVQLTKLVEKKTKASGDLTTLGFTTAGPIWVQPAQIVALTEASAEVETSEDETERRAITEVWLAGREETLHVFEDVREVIAAIGG